MELYVDLDMICLGIVLLGLEVLLVDWVMVMLCDVICYYGLEVWDYMYFNGYILFIYYLVCCSFFYQVLVIVDDIIVISGIMEVLLLVLCSVSWFGDMVVVELFIYYGLLLLLEIYQCKVVEVFMYLCYGISFIVLEKVFQCGGVVVCMVFFNVQNLFGFIMSEECKQVLVVLLVCYQVLLIENDVWGDIVYQDGVLLVKVFDKEGLVFYCNSFFKILMFGLCIGWVVVGCFQKCFCEFK